MYPVKLLVCISSPRGPTAPVCWIFLPLLLFFIPHSLQKLHTTWFGAMFLQDGFVFAPAR